MPDTKQGSAAAAPAPSTPETLAAILAKYRKDIAGGQFFTPTQEYILRLLDRIEAAAARELDEARKARDEARETAEDALWELAELRERAPGNAAALREALENARSKFIHIKKCADEGEVSRKKLTILCEFVSQEIAAALAAPARNVDRFATAQAAMEEWNKYPQSRYKGCRVCPHGDASMVSPTHLTLAEWLFAPAEGGDHA